MPNVRSVFHGTESILYFGPMILQLFPSRKVLKNESQKTVHHAGHATKSVSNLGFIKVIS